MKLQWTEYTGEQFIFGKQITLVCEIRGQIWYALTENGMDSRLYLVLNEKEHKAVCLCSGDAGNAYVLTCVRQAQNHYDALTFKEMSKMFFNSTVVFY